MPHAQRDRVVVITGASSGIGAATAVACGSLGMQVALAARRAGRLEEVAGAVGAGGGEARVVPTDVTDESAVRALVDGTVRAWGRIDALVANAGVGLLARAAETTAAEFERIMRVNFLGVVHAILATLPTMRAQGTGHLITVASVIGKRGTPFRAAYCASKFAVVGLSEVLRMELRSEGIAVTCVCPVGTVSEFHDVEENRLGVSGRGGPQQSAERVARTIVRALRRPCPEAYPYAPARALFLANVFAPGLVDRLLMRLSPLAR